MKKQKKLNLKKIQVSSFVITNATQGKVIGGLPTDPTGCMSECYFPDPRFT